MYITIAMLLFFIVEWIFFIIYIRDIGNDDMKYYTLLTTNSLTVLFSIVTYFVFKDARTTEVMNYNIVCITSILLTIINTIITLLIRKKIKNKFGHDKSEEYNTKPLILVASIFIIVFFIALLVDYKPVRERQTEIALKEDKAFIYIPKILTEKYGQARYQIIDYKFDNVCYNCSKNETKDGFVYKIKTDVMDTPFTIAVDLDNYTIVRDDFLDIYYKEKNNVNLLTKNINEELNKYYEEVINRNYNIKIDTKTKYKNIDFLTTDFGKIPAISDLATTAKITDLYFNLNDTFSTKQQIVKYLISFGNVYFNNKNVETNVFKFNYNDSTIKGLKKSTQTCTDFCGTITKTGDKYIIDLNGDITEYNISTNTIINKQR